MRRSAPVALVFLLLLMLPSAPARGCPDCRIGREARAAVFGDRFADRVLIVALPVVLLGAVGALLYRVGLPAGGRQERTD